MVSPSECFTASQAIGLTLCAMRKARRYGEAAHGLCTARAQAKGFASVAHFVQAKILARSGGEAPTVGNEAVASDMATVANT